MLISRLITSGVPGLNTPFPSELGIFLSAAILVSVALALASGRGPDPAHLTPLARYFGGVILLSLFVALFAAFSSAYALTDLIVNHTDRSAELHREQRHADLYTDTQSVTLPVANTEFDFSAERNNDANYSAAAASGFVAITAAILWLLHRRWRRRLETTPAVVSVERTTQLGTCFVTALTSAVAITSVAFGLFEIIAPGVAAGGNSAVGRAEGISEAISFGLLAIASILTFRASWRRVRPSRNAPETAGTA